MDSLKMPFAEEKLPEWVKTLAQVQFYWNENNPNNETVHVRAIVDEDKIIVRIWMGRTGWRYTVRDAYWFIMCIENGVATFVGMDEE